MQWHNLETESMKYFLWMSLTQSNTTGSSNLWPVAQCSLIATLRYYINIFFKQSIQHYFLCHGGRLIIILTYSTLSYPSLFVLFWSIFLSSFHVYFHLHSLLYHFLIENNHHTRKMATLVKHLQAKICHEFYKIKTALLEQGFLTPLCWGYRRKYLNGS